MLRHTLITTAILAHAVSCWATPISFIALYRNQVFNQTGAAQPGAASSYYGTTTVFLQNAGDFNGGTVTDPNATVSTLAADSPTSLTFSSSFGDLASFNTAWGTGTYTYNVTQSAGTNPDAPSTLTLNRTADENPGAVPYVTNWSSLQGVNAAGPVSVAWNPFAGALGAPADAFVFLVVRRASDNSAVFDAGFLSSSTTSLALPVGTLLPNTAYLYELVFSNRRITPLASGTSDFDALLGFDFRTGGSFTTAAASAVPEPGAGLLVLSGMLVVGLRRGGLRTPPRF